MRTYNNKVGMAKSIAAQELSLLFLSKWSSPSPVDESIMCKFKIKTKMYKRYFNGTYLLLTIWNSLESSSSL